MNPGYVILAQLEMPDRPAPPPGGEGRVLFWCVVLMLVVIVGFSVIVFVRRRMARNDTQSGPDAGFSLADLRTMRDRGEITSEEYEQTRARVIAKVRGKKQEQLRKELEKELGEPALEADVPSPDLSDDEPPAADSGDAEKNA